MTLVMAGCGGTGEKTAIESITEEFCGGIVEILKKPQDQ